MLAVWLILAAAAAALGAFTPAPTRPPLALPVALVGPLVLFALTYLGSVRFHDYVLGLDLGLLTMLQSWRVVGIMFVVLYAHGLLPALFAFPAGFGDFAVGVAAPFVALAILSGRAGWRRRVPWLNVAGLLDFVGAITTAVVTGSSAIGIFAGEVTSDVMTALPLSLIPTFIVPLWIILHAIALLQLARLPGQERASPS